MNYIKNFWLELNKKENFKSLVIFMCVVMVLTTYLLVKVTTTITKVIGNDYQQSKLENCLKHPSIEGCKNRAECYQKYKVKAFSRFSSKGTVDLSKEDFKNVKERFIDNYMNANNSKELADITLKIKLSKLREKEKMLIIKEAKELVEWLPYTRYEKEGSFGDELEKYNKKDYEQAKEYWDSIE